MAIKPQYDTLARRMWDAVAEKTGISDDSESSISASIIRVLAQELSNIWDELVYIDSQGQLSTATGSNLDKLGQFFGVIRKSAVAASTIGGALSVNFTNNSLSTVTIPANTRVWSSSNNQAAYYTVFALTIAPGDNGYIDVKAAAPGEVYNIGARQIDSHNSGYLNVTVSNDTPIITGQDLETDSNYRARIQQEIYRKEGSNITAIKAALIDIPGIRDVEILNFNRGAGTIDVLLYGVDRILPNSIIQQAQTVLDNTIAAGVSAIAKAPVYIPISIAVKINIKSTVSFDNVKALVSAAVIGYISNIPIENGSNNATIYYSELAARVQQSSPDIISSVVSTTINGLPSLKNDQFLDSGQQWLLELVTVS